MSFEVKAQSAVGAKSVVTSDIREALDVAARYKALRLPSRTPPPANMTSNAVKIAFEQGGCGRGDIVL